VTERSSTRTVHFGHPFLVGDRELPAGDYVLETREELVQSLSFPVWLRTATTLYVSPRPGERQAWPVEPEAIEAALARDRAAP
jgi:hypothetical protein